LIPACAARGTKLVVAGAYNSGILATGAVAGARYDYQVAAPPLLQRVARIEARCREHGVPLRAAALQFATGSTGVAAVVVGARSPAEVVDAVAMFAVPVPAVFWRALKDDGLLPPAVPVPA
jgi:D-threo-aldose 1-dehydrogenase